MQTEPLLHPTPFRQRIGRLRDRVGGNGIVGKRPRGKTFRKLQAVAPPRWRLSLTALVFVTAFALGLLLAFVKHPIFGLYAYLWTFYLGPETAWWGTTLQRARLEGTLPPAIMRQMAAEGARR